MDSFQTIVRQVKQRRRETLYDITFMWNLKKLNSLKQRVKWWLPETGSQRIGEMLSTDTTLAMNRQRSTQHKVNINNNIVL